MTVSEDEADGDLKRVAEPRTGRVHTTIQGFTGKQKIIHYNFGKLINIGPFLTLLMNGTVFNLDKNLWINMAKYLFLCGISAFFLTFLGADIEVFESESMPNIQRANENLQRFCPFLFGLFVSLSLGRWWIMRADGVGGIADYLTNLSCFLTANAVRRLPNPEDWKLFKQVHLRIVRYGLAALSCIAKESRGSTASLDDLVKLKLLTEQEKVLMEAVDPYSRAEALWCWISSLSSELMEMVKLPPPNMNMLYTHIRNGSKGVHTIHQYLLTQLPFPYVHMITLLVNAHNSVVAIVAGLKFAIAMNGGRWTECTLEIVQLLIVPTMYQGLLQICMFLSDPFGEDIIDFPILEYIIEVSEASKAMETTCRAMYAERWRTRSSPLPNASLIHKLPQPATVTGEGDRRVLELQPSAAAALPAPAVPPSQASLLQQAPEQPAVTSASEKQSAELQSAMLTSMLSSMSKTELTTTTHMSSTETMVKTALMEVGFGPSSESLEHLGKWLMDVQQHFENIPPMPNLDIAGRRPEDASAFLKQTPAITR
eukprot:TRINITY_DN26072_c0_g1_i1.p1 TRINITY_DN26072_c0_g1~~TRINITY_DN26072_c0_g1_i1.p1  ORF type:complete len:540 (-),score=87.66 TRINITY_DN26072_c0_g1_i1:61-1680(-)